MPNVFTTVPNQRTVVVHREKPERDFIQIKKENYAEAYRTLGATALVLYVYLAGNQEGYQFGLSPSAIQKALGMPESTCRDQINKLIAYRYLVERGESHVYDFYEHPQPKAEVKETTSQTTKYSGYVF